jgi:hypothetical protein
MAASLKPISSTAMKTLFLTTAAFAALIMIAPVGNAHAQVAASHVHPDSYWATFDKPAKVSTDHHRLPACSAKFVDDWNSWVPVNPGDKRPFAMPTKPCRMNDPAISDQVCNSVDCYSTQEWATLNKDIDDALPTPQALHAAEAADEAAIKARVKCADRLVEYNDGVLAGAELKAWIKNCGRRAGETSGE